MRLAMLMELSLDEYDKMTPYEFSVFVDCYNERQEKNQRDLIYQSWLAAGFQRAKKMPKLNTLLKSKKHNETKAKKGRLQDYEIEQHYNRFRKEGKMLWLT